MNTPWGASQHSKVYAPGITFYSTAGHGGFRVSSSRVAEMPDALRVIVPFAHQHRPHSLSGPGAPRWYEEDQDWAIVALAFPKLFRDYDVFCAVRTARGESEYLKPARDWLDTDPEGQRLAGFVENWKRDHANLYEQGGCSTGGKGWHSTAYRIGDGERLSIDWPQEACRSIDAGFYALPAFFDLATIERLGGRVVARGA